MAGCAIDDGRQAPAGQAADGSLLPMAALATSGDSGSDGSRAELSSSRGLEPGASGSAGGTFRELLREPCSMFHMKQGTVSQTAERIAHVQ